MVGYLYSNKKRYCNTIRIPLACANTGPNTRLQDSAVSRLLVSAHLSAFLMMHVCSISTQAQVTDRVDSYRVIPHHSILFKRGGFAGVDEQFRIIGDYDFIRQTDEGNISASFAYSELWGSIISEQPTIAVVEDVDHILNLDELEGGLLPLAHLLDVYEFEGSTSDGSSIQVHATTAGPWMYIRGRTTPPPDSADYFEYRIRLLARQEPYMDLNADGIINAADYTLLRDSGSGHYSDCKSQFGERPPNVALLVLVKS